MNEKTRRKRERQRLTRFDAYKERDALLLGIGFESYTVYRNSDLWKGIRQKVLDRDLGKCTCCKVKDAKHVHHSRYDKATLDGSDIKHLVSLCAGCHQVIEFAKWGKTGLSEATTRLRRRTRRKSRQRCYDTDPEYRSLKFQLKQARRTMPKGSERLAVMSEIKSKMRAKEMAPVVSSP